MMAKTKKTLRGKIFLLKYSRSLGPFLDNAMTISVSKETIEDFKFNTLYLSYI